MDRETTRLLFKRRVISHNIGSIDILMNEVNKLLRPNTIPDDNLGSKPIKTLEKTTLIKDNNKNVKDLKEY